MCGSLAANHVLGIHALCQSRRSWSEAGNEAGQGTVDIMAPTVNVSATRVREFFDIPPVSGIGIGHRFTMHAE